MSKKALKDGGFAERVGQYFAAATAAAKTWYDAEGQWTADSLPSCTRERMWFAFAPYACGEAAFADAVIRPGESPKYGDVIYNIFDTNIAVALLAEHRDKMAPDIRAKLERLARDGFNFKPGNRQPDYQFHGYNDNMPAKATMGLVLGGELMGDADAVEYGLWDLRQLRAMLVRRGTNSEYNSPTYSGLTIHAMGEIAEHAQNEEARQLALDIEHRLWIDLAARFHPEIGVIAGPYSRAYTADTLAHLSGISSLLWFVLGDRVRPSPMLLFKPGSGLVLHHMGDAPFNTAQMCWFASGTYHLPPAAEKMFAKKKYPFQAVASCEHGDAGADFPARPCRIETVLHEDFTLGTSSTPFCGGEQTMSYFVTYKRKAEVESFEDVGTVYSKMVLDDEVPGTIQTPQMPLTEAEAKAGKKPVPASNSGEEDCLTSHANTLTLQSCSTAMVLTHPHLSLGGPADGPAAGQTGGKPLTALSELVVFPSHFGGAEEISVGGKTRDLWAGTVGHGEWIACRRGRLLIAIRPMVYSRTLGPVSITLEKVNRYEVIRSTFYRGEKRAFSRNELRHVFGGFVAEHAGADEFPTLDDFVQYVSQSKFTDYFWTTRRARYRRPDGAMRPALEFEVSWSTGFHVPRIAAINGREVTLPVAEIDGIKTDRLPFLSEPFKSVPSFFPWQDFRVEWGEWPYAIGNREE